MRGFFVAPFDRIGDLPVRRAHRAQRGGREIDAGRNFGGQLR